MYALAFDLVVADVRKHHPAKNATRAYVDIKNVLMSFGFVWTQGSLYVIHNEDMSVLFRAISSLMALPWFPQSVRDIRAFRVEQWSDFTATVKGTAGSTGGSPKA